MNTPYIKQYDANGQLINPGNIISRFPNRRQRRHREPRFMGNGKNYHLTVLGNEKFHRVKQFAMAEDGTINRIEHYIVKTRKS